LKKRALEEESTFKWEPFGVWLVGALVELGCIKSIGTPNFYYILMNFLGYRVFFGVYIVHPRRRRRRTTTTTTLGALT
jgi:hypothetical protein